MSIKVDLVEMQREIRRAWRAGLNWKLNAKRGGWAFEAAVAEHVRTVQRAQSRLGRH